MSERLAGGFFIFATALLAFIGGAYVTLDRIFPYDLLNNAYRAGNALVKKQIGYSDLYTTDLWRAARSEDRGVTIDNRERAFAGYTLYTSGDGPTARLVAMDGTVVHEWHRPFSTVWNEEAAVKDPQPDNYTYFRRAKLLPNGDLIAIYVAVGDTPWGYGTVKMDRDGEVIWSYLEQTHHDLDIAANGNVYLLTHEVTNEVIKDYEKLERPRLNDFLVILSPDGQELKKVSLTHALLRSRFKGLLYSIPFFALGDPLHTNAVKVITESQAEVFPYGEPGQVLLSFREPGLVAVLDVESETVVWATRGPWLGQHDPHILENGNILLFDNLSGQETNNASQVLEFNPTSMEIVWRYRGNPDHPFESPIRSTVQALPNGNVLATESDGGRIFEVARDGEIVWEYINPIRGGEEQSYIPVLSGGQRIAADTLDPSFVHSLRAP